MNLKNKLIKWLGGYTTGDYMRLKLLYETTMHKLNNISITLNNTNNELEKCKKQLNIKYINRIPLNMVKGLEDYFMNIEYENKHIRVTDFHNLAKEYNISMTTIRNIYKGKHTFSSKEYKGFIDEKMEKQ